MKKIIHKHPLAIRWFHWVNFPVLGVMIWSGLLIYWANSIYHIDLGKIQIRFFPAGFYEALHVPYKLALGMSWHFAMMWAFFFNGFLYVLYTLISGEWRYLVPDKDSFKEAWQVLLFDLHLSKIQPPQQKYNAAQRIAYSAIIIMGTGSVLSGMAIYKPVEFSWICAMLGGYESARLIHFILTIGYVLFFVIHVVQVIIAGWNNFRAMVTGYEISSKKVADL